MLGSYLGQVFTVSDRKILTFSGLSGSSGGTWARHDVTGGKSRSQFVGPQLRSYSFDIVLRAQDGVSPRKTADFFREAAEKGLVDYFVVGGTPLSSNPFLLESVSEDWETILPDGTLTSCKLSLQIKEYL